VKNPTRAGDFLIRLIISEVSKPVIWYIGFLENLKEEVARSFETFILN